MKFLIFSVLVLFLTSCGGEKATSVFIIVNETFHSIDLTFYDLPRVEHSIKINSKSTDNTLIENGAGARLLTDTYDSVTVTYDDTISITHVNQYGTFPEYMDNHILNDGSWIFIQSTDVKKKLRKLDFVYLINEEDYKRAL